MIWALPQSPLRRLALSMLFTIATTSYQTTCTVSERTPIKGTLQCKPMQCSSFALQQLSTDEHKTIFMNVTQMLSNQTSTPRLKWLDNLSSFHQPQKLFNEHPLLPQHNHLLLLQHPSKLQPEALHQQPTPSR